jgi:hypothetical protein
VTSVTRGCAGKLQSESAELTQFTQVLQISHSPLLHLSEPWQALHSGTSCSLASPIIDYFTLFNHQPHKILITPTRSPRITKATNSRSELHSTNTRAQTVEYLSARHKHGRIRSKKLRIQGSQYAGSTKSDRHGPGAWEDQSHHP